MYDWVEMAAVVGRKLVENGQNRILQRIYDGVTSDLFLDVSDFKESDNHKLLHLVWRKFPRNRHATEGQRTIKSLSTQTVEGSSQESSQESKLSGSGTVKWFNLWSYGFIIVDRIIGVAVARTGMDLIRTFSSMSRTSTMRKNTS